jgi:hypothetical protein
VNDLPDPRMIPPGHHPWFGAEGAGPAGETPALADQSDVDGADDFIRPFIVTEGRTQPLRDGLRIETMVRALPAALSAPLRFEKRRLVELCQTPLSLAEIAAGMGVPLGVARVLVADLANSNLLSFQEPEEVPTHVIERIRDLVRAL